jgi:ArsR family transcriptional regulator, lead/cadmium/zinc/bismuth-responsive transcriptional repressor
MNNTPLNYNYDRDVADFFKVFSDPTRVSILRFLMGGARFVHEISEQLGMNHSAVSHQLRTLRQARLVSSLRSGKFISYSLDDSHIENILAMGIEHLCEGKKQG